MHQPAPVRLERRGDIALITIDNPPVNASSQAVRQGLFAAVRETIADDQVKAAVIACAGATFVAGADIREFKNAPPPPDLPQVINVIEQSPKPFVAAIHGTALGGGCELALACHARVMRADASLGLPEVKLGIIPGAGGTQRMPRLAGMLPALDMITSGRMVKAKEAFDLGIVDEIVAGDHVEAALAFAAKLAGQEPRRTKDIPVAAFDRAAFDAKAADVKKKARGRIAEAKAIDAILLAAEVPFEQGAERERDMFKDLRASPQSEALRHLFFAERESAKAPDLAGVKPRIIETIGIIGAGTMGSGIALAFADSGFPVTIVETNAEALEHGRARVEALYDRAMKSGRIDAAGKSARLARYTFTTDFDALAACDLIIEAAFEELDVKRAIFGKLDAIAKPGAVLASNTSYLDVNLIAQATRRPKDVIGMHFFSPANIMRLVEVVRPDAAAPDAIATGIVTAKKLGKIPVLSGVCDGFIGNRILSTYRRQTDYMLEDGALPHEVDGALEQYGFAMGPFAVSDLAGLDISWARRKRLNPTRDPRERYSAIADQLCEQGRYGQKTGSGYYRYFNGKRAIDPAVNALVEQVSRDKGIRRRLFKPDDILARVRAAIVNEAAKILEEGIALRPGDIDVVLVHGYGFPAWRGGPLHEADRLGLASTLSIVRETHARDGLGFEPSALLTRLVDEGRSFADWAAR